MSAPAYRITATYETSAAVARWYIEEKIRDIYNAKFSAQKLKVTGITVTGYKSFEVAPHIVKQQVTLQVTVEGSPIAQVVILAVLAVVALGLVAVGIHLVGKEIIEPLGAGAPILAAGAGVFLLLVALVFLMPKAVPEVKKLYREVRK